MIIYGIPNCDTMKKARAWLETNGLEFSFHNYKKSGLEAATLEKWIQQVGWEVLVNKRGTTWRQLDPAAKENLNATSAAQLMLANTSLIKRPVLDNNQQLLVGFDAATWHSQLLS